MGPPGAPQDPNSSTRSIGEPGMPEISCIANDADDLRPLGLTSRPQFLLPMRPGVGPIFGTYVSLARPPTRHCGQFPPSRGQALGARRGQIIWRMHSAPLPPRRRANGTRRAPPASSPVSVCTRPIVFVSQFPRRTSKRRFATDRLPTIVENTCFPSLHPSSINQFVTLLYLFGAFGEKPLVRDCWLAQCR